MKKKFIQQQVDCCFSAVAIALVLHLFAGYAAAKAIRPAATQPLKPDLIIPMLDEFRLDDIPAHDKYPWIAVKVLSPKAKAGNNVYQVQVLVRLHTHGAAIPNKILIYGNDWLGIAAASVRPLSLPDHTDYTPHPDTFYTEEVLVFQLGKKGHGFPKIAVFPPYRSRVYPVNQTFEIPSRFASQLAPGWRYYNTHKKMFGSKPTAGDQKLLQKLLSGKNIFLAQEAWLSVLQLSYYHSEDENYVPLTQKFVEHLLPSIGPERESYFIYAAFNEAIEYRDRKLIPAVLAIKPLVDKVTTSAQLLPVARACAYISVWTSHYHKSAGLAMARSLLREIQKKVAVFNTHTDADKRIAMLLKFAKPSMENPAAHINTNDDKDTDQSP